MPATLMSICKRGDDVFGTRNLEVHVDEMIFVAEDVG